MTNSHLSDPTSVLRLENLASESGIEAPFPARPFQVVSLLDMLRYYAGLFHLYCTKLEEFQHALGHRAESRGQDSPVTTEEAKEALTIIQDISQECKRINLERSLERLERLTSLLPRYTELKFSLTHLIWEMNELNIAIAADLGDRRFFSISEEEAKLYENDDLFGTEVSSRFPKANDESRIAGTCYAMNNYTGCVFHLMRAVEYGARTMLKELGVQTHENRPIELCDWGGLGAALNVKLNDLSIGRRNDAQKMQDFEFFSYPIHEFEKFRTWRNKVSHLREEYLPGHTKDIMDATERYLRHLATRFNEVD